MDRSKMVKIFLEKVQNNYLLVIFFMFLFFVLRVLYLDKNLFFGYEQSRDLFLVKEIINGDFKLLGPSTDIAGIFHGVLYFYILVPLLMVSKGDPYIIQTSIIFINSISILFLFDAVKRYHNKRIALFAIILYTVSYSSVVYSRWLSNTNLIPVATVFLYWFLIKSKENRWFMIGAVISWASIFHFHEVVGVSLMPSVLVFVLAEKLRLKIYHLIFIVATLLMSLSTYIIFEIKNNFIMSNVFLDYVGNQGTGSKGLSFIFSFVEELVDNFYTLSPRFSFLIVSVLIFLTIRYTKLVRNELISISFLILPTCFLGVMGIVPLRHFYIYVPIFLSIVVAIILDSVLQRKNSLFFNVLLLTIVGGNLISYFKIIPSNKPTFIYHAQRTHIGDLKNILDWVYGDAEGKEFSYDYYSIPYWKEEMWIYMFNWYGLSKYGYLPTRNKRTDVFYTLMEPNETTPVHRDNWYGEYKKELNLIDYYESGKLRAEKRTVVNNIK